MLKKQIQKDDVKKSCRREWTNQEDQKLKKVIDENGTNWKVVASAMHDRNPSQCAQRWKRLKPSSDKNRKGWTKEEDDSLIQLVLKYNKNWSQIAKVMTQRTGKQIRERFINQLDPDNKVGDWTQEEDLMILEVYQKFGSRWTKISKMMVGRPENAIKNRFYSYIRQAYMNIANPYYVLPDIQDGKTKKRLSQDIVKVEEANPSQQTNNSEIKKQRSLSFDSIHYHPQIVQRSKFQFEDIKQQFNEFLMENCSSRDLKKSLSFKPEDMYPGQIFRTDNQYPSEFNPELFLGAYNQPIISYSLTSDKRLPQRNNLNGSLSLQMSSGGLGNAMVPFQLCKRSLGMSEENPSIFSNQMSGDFRAPEAMGFYQHPFQQLFNANVVALPVLMRNDLDILGMQMESIKINEKK